MRRLSAIVLLATLPLVACKSTPAAKAPAPGGTSTATANGTKAPGEEPRLTVDNGSLPGAERRLRIAGVALRASPFFLPIVGFARSGPYATLLAKAEKSCGFNPIHAIDDVAWSQGADGWLLVLKPALGEDEALECVAKLADGTVTKRAGRGFVQTALFSATARDGVLVVGNDTAVEVFLAAPATSEERRALHLDEGELLRGAGALPADPRTHVETTLTYGKGRPTADGKGSEKVEARISAEFDDAKTAEALVDRLEGLRDQAKLGAKNPRSRAVLDSFHFSHPGRRFVVEFGTQGDKKAIVEYIDFLVGLYELFAAEEGKSP